MTIPNGMAMGFEVDTTVLHYFTSTTITAGSPATTITIGAGGRNSTQGLLVAIPNNKTAADGGGLAIKTLPSSLSTIYQAFAFSTNVLPVSGQQFALLALRESGTTHVDLRLFADGTLRATRAGTALGTGSFTASVNVFYHVEMKAVIHNSTGTIDVLVNGASILSLTGQDTQNGGTGVVTEIAVGAQMQQVIAQTPATTVKFDDLVTSTNAFVGDCRVREDLPTGTGSTDDGVATGAADSQHATDEAPPDDDTTYAELANIGDKILLTYATIPTSEVIVAAGLMPYAKKSTAGTATFKTNIKIGATEYTPGSDQAPSAGSYAYFQDLMMVSPDTATAFTATELNGAEIGIEKTS